MTLAWLGAEASVQPPPQLPFRSLALCSVLGARSRRPESFLSPRTDPSVVMPLSLQEGWCSVSSWGWEGFSDHLVLPVHL